MRVCHSPAHPKTPGDPRRFLWVKRGQYPLIHVVSCGLWCLSGKLKSHGTTATPRRNSRQSPHLPEVTVPATTIYRTMTDATARSNATGRPRTPPNGHSPKPSGPHPACRELDTDPGHHRLRARRSLVERDQNNRRSPGTLRLHRDRLDRQIIPSLGSLRIRELTVGTVDRHLRSVTDSNGPAVAKAVRSVLSGMCRLACTHDALQRNPVRDATPITTKATANHGPSPSRRSGSSERC